jgi:tRNA pseudouridine55 synthase
VNAVAPQRPPRRAVHGVLVLHKPKGMSSTDALVRAKRLYRAEKGGHTGTLDPLASGLLPLCFGAATKFAQASLEADKHYRAVVRLGQTTASADAETSVLVERPVSVDRAAVEAACAAFTGPLSQVPPMYSALKQDGKALYELARQGIEVERAPRQVHIHRIDVLAFEAPLLTLQVHCSKGTYIRTLAEGIGEHLGCGAHLAELQRNGSGPLNLLQAHTLEALAELAEPQRDALLLKPDALLRGWPQVQLAASEAARFLTGLRRRVELPDAPAMRVYGPDLAFLGSAHVKSGELIAQRLLSPLEVAAFAA